MKSEIGQRNFRQTTLRLHSANHKEDCRLWKVHRSSKVSMHQGDVRNDVSLKLTAYILLRHIFEKSVLRLTVRRDSLRNLRSTFICFSQNSPLAQAYSLAHYVLLLHSHIMAS